MEAAKNIDYEKWLSLTIENLHQALDHNNIGKLDGRLWKSIMGEVIHSGQDVEKIVIKFIQYGRFVDMGVGVGRGVKNGKRKVKPWFSKTKTREVARLRTLLINDMAIKAIQEVEAGMKDDLEISLINKK
ncbi:MAG: hypothetical protein E6Q66_06335 [Pedobacter sp.]|jgi:hypothetical protein|nr:MAG: hypothetical protein E6Q66_06335 [Pedobacter sp.]